MLVLFDVNGTLLSLEPVTAALTVAGAPADVLPQWFTRLLQSAAAATLAGRYRPFPEFAGPALAQTLAVRGLPDDALEPALAALRDGLAAQPDAAGCLDALRAAGHRAAALTNSPADSSLEQLRRAGLADRLEAVLSCDTVGRAKPAPEPYRHALERLDGDPADTVLVAAHGWDCLGAAAVGLGSVGVRRLERRWALPGQPPDRTADTLADVPALLG